MGAGLAGVSLLGGASDGTPVLGGATLPSAMGARGGSLPMDSFLVQAERDKTAATKATRRMPQGYALRPAPQWQTYEHAL
jgi:hypothetical protein